MRRPGVVTLVAWLTWSAPAAAHRLDEFLQATRIVLQPDAVELEIDLTPGVEVAAAVIQAIDTDRDGVLTEPEQAAYASLVLETTRLTLDGRPLTSVPTAHAFPPVADLTTGTGTIHLRARADAHDLLRGAHELHYVNGHAPPSSAYLVNAMMPPDGVRITRQRRDREQREIVIDVDGPDGPWRPWTLLGIGASVLALLWYLRRGTGGTPDSTPRLMQA